MHYETEDQQSLYDRLFIDVGGMQTKLEAAELAQQAGIESWIVNGHEDEFLLGAMEDRCDFSKIMASNNKSGSHG